MRKTGTFGHFVIAQKSGPIDRIIDTKSLIRPVTAMCNLRGLFEVIDALSGWDFYVNKRIKKCCFNSDAVAPES